MKSVFPPKTTALILTALLAASSLSIAQQYKVEIDKPTFDGLLSPDVDGKTTLKKFKQKEWLEVEVKIKIEASDKKETFADRVSVRWFVGLDVTENGATRPRVIEKEVDYVNVPLNEDVYISVYLSPSAVMRMSGRDRATEGLIMGAAGEITVNGVTPYKNSGMFSTLPKSKGKWWDELPRYNKIPLRNKNETPFKFFWWDRYAEIEERR